MSFILPGTTHLHHADTAEAETTSFPLPQEMLDCSKLYDSQKDFDTRQT